MIASSRTKPPIVARGTRRAVRHRVRAQRYPLNLPVQYRRAGETDWHAGITENISDSGAVIRTDEAMPPSTRVAIVIALPSSAARARRTLDRRRKRRATCPVERARTRVRSGGDGIHARTTRERSRFTDHLACTTRETSRRTSSPDRWRAADAVPRPSADDTDFADMRTWCPAAISGETSDFKSASSAQSAD